MENFRTKKRDPTVLVALLANNFNRDYQERPLKTDVQEVCFETLSLLQVNDVEVCRSVKILMS